VALSTSGFRDRRRSPGLATPATEMIVKSLIKEFFIWVSIQVNITVTLSRTKETKKLQIEEGLTVENILKKINLKPDTIIVMSKNKPVPIDTKIKDGQELTILQVSSGG
jgi:sulfur carrier protein ThiS